MEGDGGKKKDMDWDDVYFYLRSPITLIADAGGVQYKAWFCSCLIAGIAGSNPTEGMEVQVRLLLSVVCLAASAKN
jgi:hypothetical protein